MGGKKILITITDEQYDKIERIADGLGLRVSTFVKSEVVKIARASEPENVDRQTLTIEVTNYRELLGYVEQKHFGSIASFATFAMESVMQRNQLTEAQKARIGKSVG